MLFFQREKKTYILQCGKILERTMYAVTLQNIWNTCFRNCHISFHSVFLVLFILLFLDQNPMQCEKYSTDKVEMVNMFCACSNISICKIFALKLSFESGFVHFILLSIQFCATYFFFYLVFISALCGYLDFPCCFDYIFFKCVCSHRACSSYVYLVYLVQL